MLFGDRSDFAIEAEVDTELSLAGVWGRMCVWCAGTPLGNIDEPGCALYPAYASFRGLASCLDTLWAEDLSGLDDVAIWSFLDGELYGTHDDAVFVDERKNPNGSVDPEDWKRFDFLTNWGEPFDACKAFILCPPGSTVRVLWRQLPENALRGADVSRAGIMVAIDDFNRWFEDKTQERQQGAGATGDT